ncbi:MAG TPA: permease [Nakamurella sp.]
MTTSRTRTGGPPAGPEPRQRYRPGSLELFGVILLLAILLRGPLESLLGQPALQSWATVFIAICVQATPFLVLGVVVSGAIAAFIPAAWFSKVLPDRPVLAVPVATVCGAALPGCECGSVPISNRLIDRGVRPSASLAFMLSAPAINPIVLVATAVAFAGYPSMVWARLIAGLLTAVIVGWIWERIGRPEWMRPKNPARTEPGQSGWRVFLSTILGDFTQAAGFLVIGAAAAATFKTIVPAHIMEGIGASLLLSILLMAGLAFILALCSEADAFVAASFSTIPMVGKLVFLTVGPAVDVKLFAMQAGVFGRKFAVRFAPLTFGVAVLVATVVGLLFWGWQ